MDAQSGKKKMGKLKTFDLVRNVLSIAIYLVFNAYRIARGKGLEWLNWAILGVTVVYFVFFMINVFMVKSGRSRKVGTKVYKWTKRGLLLLNALMTIASVVSAGKSIDAASVIFAVFTVLNFVIQIALAVIIRKIAARLAIAKAKFTEARDAVKNIAIAFRGLFGRKETAAVENVEDLYLIESGLDDDGGAQETDIY